MNHIGHELLLVRKLYFIVHFFQMRLSLNLVGRLALLSFVAVCVNGQQKAERCDPSYCRLPDCNCGGTDIPGGYDPQDIPQFVLLTFDDAVNSLNEKFFGELFKERLNPNGCPIKVINCFNIELPSSELSLHIEFT